MFFIVLEITWEPYFNGKYSLIETSFIDLWRNSSTNQVEGLAFQNDMEVLENSTLKKKKKGRRRTSKEEGKRCSSNDLCCREGICLVVILLPLLLFVIVILPLREVVMLHTDRKLHLFNVICPLKTAFIMLPVYKSFRPTRLGLYEASTPNWSSCQIIHRPAFVYTKPYQPKQ